MQTCVMVSVTRGRVAPFWYLNGATTDATVRPLFVESAAEKRKVAPDAVRP